MLRVYCSNVNALLRHEVRAVASQVRKASNDGTERQLNAHTIVVQHLATPLVGVGVDIADSFGSVGDSFWHSSEAAVLLAGFGAELARLAQGGDHHEGLPGCLREAVVLLGSS